MLGLRARCKDTGDFHVGHVVGIVEGYIYLNGKDPRTFAKWNRLFPGWETSDVAYIGLDEPQRICTLEEFKEAIPLYSNPVTDEAKLKDMYDKQVGYTTTVACPVAGLQFLTKEVLRVKVFEEIAEERQYQDACWGGKSEDVKHSETTWLHFINEYANGTGRAEGRDFRERMIKAAALCVAAVEALDYKTQQEKVGG